MNVSILHLYPKEMNLYGDHGNVLALKKRLEWRGYKVKVWEHEPGMELPRQIDIIFGGGGQDSGQGKIEKDLIRIAPKLKALIEDDIPALVICGFLGVVVAQPAVARVVFGGEEKLIVVLPVGADLAVLDVESSELMQCCRN